MDITNFDANAFIKGKRKPTVAFPTDLGDSICALYGYYHKKSNYYNVIPLDTNIAEIGGEKPILLGHFYGRNDDSHNSNDMISGQWECKELMMGSMLLKKLDYSTEITDLNIKASDTSVLKVDETTCKVMADNLGSSILSILNGDELIGEYEIRVVTIDDDLIESGNTIRMIQSDVAAISVKKKAKFTTSNGEICELEPYQLKTDIFSRNTGILESDIMLKKGALIIGCGSVGSLVALELARAGVGRFFLVDGDIFSYHNICRHQCGLEDVGKFKTQAVKERILKINPYAEVHTSSKMIQDVSLMELDKFCNSDTIVVGCADNREGDLYADSILAKEYKMPFISIGCWERAYAGEIFYCLPEGMPAYSDFVSKLGDLSERTIANTHLYMGEVGSFEPGISVDINFVTTIAVKMILDILNRDNQNYTQRVINSLTQYTLICNTNDTKIGGEMAEIFSYPLQVTRSIEVDYSDK